MHVEHAFCDIFLVKWLVKAKMQNGCRQIPNHACKSKDPLYHLSLSCRQTQAGTTIPTESDTHLHALQEIVGKGSEVSMGCEAHHEDHEHDGQLEVGVQSGCKDLGGCQC